MRYYRSFPKDIPPNRNYVVDQLPRLTTDGVDLRTAPEPLPDANFTLLEWDMVVSPEELRTWEYDCNQYPSRIIVAPYLLYPASTGHKLPFWAHHNLLDQKSGDYSKGLTPVKTNEPRCDHFSFGMIYFPYWAWSEFIRTTNRPWNDTQFSIWFYERYPHEGAWINWSVRPIHLHY